MLSDGASKMLARCRQTETFSNSSCILHIKICQVICERAPPKKKKRLPVC